MSVRLRDAIDMDMLAVDDAGRILSTVTDRDPEDVIARLPTDHCALAADGVRLSDRGLAFLSTISSPQIRMYGFWDHAVRSMSLAIGTLSIDIAGLYRLA